jgi:hypothetical protein
MFRFASSFTSIYNENSYVCHETKDGQTQMQNLLQPDPLTDSGMQLPK